LKNLQAEINQASEAKPGNLYYMKTGGNFGDQGRTKITKKKNRLTIRTVSRKTSQTSSE